MMVKLTCIVQVVVPVAKKKSCCFVAKKNKASMGAKPNTVQRNHFADTEEFSRKRICGISLRQCLLHRCLSVRAI